MGHLIRDCVTGSNRGLHLELYGFHRLGERACDEASPCTRPEEPFDGYWVMRVTGDNKLEELHNDALKTEPTAEQTRAMAEKWLRSGR